MFSSHPKSKFWSKKNNTSPNNVALYSNKKYWFDCSECNHSFDKILNDIVGKNSWCAYCANQKICDCQICFKKSFASHPKSKYWSIKNKINPNKVFKYSNKKYWFDCKNCNHEFYTAISSITYRKNWCYYCGNKKLCEKKDCKTCFNKSFASHKKSKYLLKENSRLLFKNNHTKYFFKCNICSHDFKISLLNVNNNYWCCYCGNKKLCENKNCKICFDKSFASHKKSKFWTEKNNQLPRKVFKNTHKKYWFKCEKEHLFSMALYNVKNEWCPKCNESKGEVKITEYLEQNNNKFKPQKTFNNLKYKKSLRYDFYLENYKLIIEYDGEQHFNSNTKYKHFDKNYKIRRIKDLLKNKYCLENNYILLRISYKEFNFIENIIQTTLNRIKRENFKGIIYSNLELYKFPKACAQQQA